MANITKIGNITTTQWLKAAGIRCLKTACQAAIAIIGTGAVGVLDTDWVGVASAAAMAAILSLLTSVAGLPECSGCEEAEG